MSGQRAALEAKYHIDHNHLITNTTDPMMIFLQKPYCTATTCPTEWAMMHYRPKFGLNTLYLIIFGILLVNQLFFGIKKKTYKYCVTVSLGVLGEMVGYIGRLMFNMQPFSMDNFLTNLVPLTIAPALLTGGIYLCLGRVITAVGAEHSRLKPKLYTYVFVGSDLISLILQAAGGAMASMANTKKDSDLGVHIMIAGLIFQVVSMTVFFAIWGDFALRVRKARRAGALQNTQPPLYRQLRDSGLLRWFQFSLFFATVLIFIRCLYRVAELWGGFESELANHEVTFMLFEGPMIICAVTAMTIFHPGRVFDQLWDAAGKGVRSMKEDDEGVLMV